MTRALWPLDPARYVRHPLHRDQRVWPESNCYVDLWVELLHTWGADPLAALPFTFTIDTEGDQWTFFKFPLADLDLLYGVAVIELCVWRSLIDHLDEQLALGRPCLVEVDAFYLPDTAGTSYHTEHVKTSIGIQALDADGQRVGYFHNAGYYELEGADFAGVFRLHESAIEGGCLPPYVEVAKLGTRAPRAGRALVDASLDRLRTHLAKVPLENPFDRYGVRFAADLDGLDRGSLTQFHRYAFATLRQCGAAFELGGEYVRWLQANGEPGLEPVAGACDVIATTARVLEFKAARCLHANRRFDHVPLLATMARAWQEATSTLARRYGVLVHEV